MIRCSEKVWRGYHMYPCNGAVCCERDGKPLCAMHDPERREMRAKSRQAAYEQRERLRRIRMYAPELLDALKKLCHQYTAANLSTAQEAIAMAEGSKK